jgi:hypothetical protein
MIGRKAPLAQAKTGGRNSINDKPTSSVSPLLDRESRPASLPRKRLSSTRRVPVFVRFAACFGARQQISNRITGKSSTVGQLPGTLPLDLSNVTQLEVHFLGRAEPQRAKDAYVLFNPPISKGHGHHPVPHACLWE